MKTLLAVFTLSCVSAQIERPSLGMMVDSSGAARPVFGLPGSISTGDPVATDVLSSGCSALFCLLKTESGVVFQGQSTAAPPGRAIFAFSGAGAFLYFPQSQQFAYWNNGRLDPLDVDVAGEVLSIRAPSGVPEFAIRQEGLIRVVRGDNAIVDSLPPDARLVMLLDRAIVYGTAGAIVLQRPDGSELRFPLAHPRSFSALGAGYLQIRTGVLSYALRTEAGREQLFLLPEPAQ